MVDLVNTYGVLLEEYMKTIIQTNDHVVLVVLRILHQLLVLTIIVGLVILTAISTYTVLIHSGMAKVVVVLRNLVVLDPTFHGFIRLWGPQQLTPLK